MTQTNPEVETLRAQVARLRESAHIAGKHIANNEPDQATVILATALSDIPAPAVGWRKYPKQKPGEDGFYLVYTDLTNMEEMKFADGGFYDSAGNFYEAENITHWMPLPTPPSQEG